MGLQHPLGQENIQKADLNQTKGFFVGQRVYCNVLELLSPFDREGIIMDVDGDIYTVKFYTKIIKINKIGLTPR